MCFHRWSKWRDAAKDEEHRSYSISGCMATTVTTLPIWTQSRVCEKCGKIDVDDDDNDE